MNGLLQRVRSGAQRFGDWLNGQAVRVDTNGERHISLGGPTARPLVDVYEDPYEIVLVADTPGAMPDTTDIHVDPEHITIVGRVPRVPGRRLFGNVCERDWAVTFATPEHIDRERAHASLRHGVLTVHLPKSARRGAHQILVKPA